ncbi:hypothetical protein GCM10009590_30890 [Brachybacterium alimentarium]
MGGEDHECPLGDLVDLVDEDGALLAQAVDDELVVHDLVAHVHGLVEMLEGAFDGDHSPVDTRAVAARFGKKDGSVAHATIVGGARSGTAVPWRKTHHTSTGWSPAQAT